MTPRQALEAMRVEDATDRLVVADILEEAGRSHEAALLRSGKRLDVTDHWKVVPRAWKYFVTDGQDHEHYTVYVCPRWLARRFRRQFPQAEEIDRSLAVRLGWSCPQEWTKLGGIWQGGGFLGHMNAEPETVTEALEHCRDATETAVQHREQEAKGS